VKKTSPLIKKTCKAIIWVALICVFIFVITAILIRIPAVQTRIIEYATSFVSNKTDTRVEIKKIGISFPKSVVAEGLFLEDLKKDTLLFVSRAKINITLRDLLSEKVTLKSVVLEKAVINLNRPAIDSLFNYSFLISALRDKNNQKKSRPRRGNKWTVSVRDLSLKNTRFQFENGERPETENKFESGYISLDHITLEAKDLYYSSDTVRVSVRKFTAVDQNKFSINQFETDFLMDRNAMTAKNLIVKTAGSSIAADFKIGYSSRGTLKDSLHSVNITLDMKSLIVSNSDIVYFIPKLSGNEFFKNGTNISTLSGTVKGRFNNLNGHNIVLTTATGTRIITDFTVAGLPDIKTASWSLPKLELRTGRQDVEMIAGESIPSKIELPENIEAEIVFNGNLRAFESSVSLTSSFGSAKIAASVDEYENFLGKAIIEEFNLGRLLRDTAMLGPVSLTAETRGHGFDKTRFNAEINTEVSRIRINKYTYHKLHADGNISGRKFEGRVTLNDENAMLDFNGLMNFSRSGPAYKFLLKIIGVDLKKLGLTKDDIRLSLALISDLRSDTASMLNGRAGISNLIIARDEKIFMVDSLLFASVNEPGNVDLNHSEALMGVKYSGTVSLAAITSGLTGFINSYFPFSENTRMQNRTDSSNFKFEILLHNHPVISQVLLPELKEFEPGIISGSFNSQKKDLKLGVTLKKVVYGATEIKDFMLDVHSDLTAINWIVSLSSISNSRVRLDKFLFDGKIAGDAILAGISSSDKENKKLVLSSKITKPDDSYRIEIDPKDFFLMNNRWDIEADNYILFGKEGLMIHDFNIRNAASQINIASANGRFNDDLKIGFRNFNLGEISRIIEKDTSLVKGIVDGNVLFKRVGRAYGLIADATVTGLRVHDIPVGNISVRADNPTAGKFDFGLAISGPDNTLTAKGFYIPGGGDNSFRIDTDIQSLSVNILEAFSKGQFSETSGTLSGHATVTGTPAEPEITGELVFNNVFVNPAILNSRLELKHETVTLGKDGINFSSFTVADASGNTAVINGTVHMTRFKDFVFNINVSAENFLLMNTSPADNKVYYGRMIIETRIDVSGPLKLPVASGTIVLKKGSNFTFAVPEEKLSSDKGEGVVEFDDTLSLNSIVSGAGKPTARYPGFKGVDLSAIVEIDKQATLRLLMDPVSDDSLVVRGAAALSFDMDRSGKMSLTGAFNVNEGNYIVSLQSLVKRKFDIIPGSTILWSGDPLDAEISINAKYAVRAAPYDLVAVQMSTLSDVEKAGYRQQYPFWVMMKLRGAILHPLISFEIELPPEDKGILNGAVNQKLVMLNDDESALNKQVFALLVLGRFVQENPLQSESGGTSTLVRSTVGNFLSAQLNRLSNKVIPGAELNFDVQSYNDYQTGEARGRTEVEIGVKKQLFDERLSVQLGGSVDVEGEMAGKNSASDITGDVEIEYKLTPDGRYRLKAFRHNQYEGAIEGQLIESGVGIVYMRDFNKWRDVFRALKRKRDLSEKERKNEKVSNK
jgi:hypothetical protein